MHKLIIQIYAFNSSSKFFRYIFLCVDNFQNNNWPKQPTIYERPILTLEVEKYTIQQKYSVPIYPASGQGERPLSGRGVGVV